jgi:hypothetical protein
MRTIAVEAGVDFLQAADEVEDLVSWVGASGGGAEMRAATEGAGFVNETAGAFGVEERAASVMWHGQVFATRGSEGFCGDKGFASGELGDFTGEMELAAFGAERAIPLQWSRGEVGVDLQNLGGGFHFQTGEGIGRGHGLVWVLEEFRGDLVGEQSAFAGERDAAVGELSEAVRDEFFQFGGIEKIWRNPLAGSQSE